MEYGLRRYEAIQRLLWFLFFFICLGVAYLAIPSPSLAPSKALSMPHSFQPEVLKSFDFWFNLRWIRVEPLGRLMIYLVWVALLFLCGRLLGLTVQYGGKYYVSSLLATNIGRPDQAERRSGLSSLPAKSEVTLPVLILLKKTDNILLQILFHPLRRLRVLLNDPQRTCSGEGLAEKERRLSETDWEILWSSWTPFRWLLRLLPVVGVVQTVWLLHLHLQPSLFGQKDLQEVFGLAFNALFPLIQAIFLTVVFSLSSGLLKRLESLYLSGVDAMFYDRFLTKMPFQSTDTPILIEMLQSSFQELQARLSRIEQILSEGRDPMSRWK
jgi:hypothetical protein